MTLLAFLGVALAVVAVALGCNGWFAPRLRQGRVSRGTAAGATLLALLVAPTVAALLIALVSATALPGVYGATLYFYAGYAVGLVCFIVLNRRYRALAVEDRA